MKLDAWQLITSIIEAGGVFKDGAYRVRNSSGQLHREDGPAVVYPDGSHSWCRNNQLHREDGPAAIYPDGSQHWYRNGQLHREDGPAVIYRDGRQYWYLNGESVKPGGGDKT